jgi:MFS family permease
LAVRRLVPILGEKGIVLLGGSVLATACALHAAMPVWQLFPVAMVLFGLGYVTLHGTLQTRATELDPAARATAVSLFAFTFFLGQGTGPVVVGLLKSAGGPTLAFGLAAGCVAALTLYVHRAVTKPRPV